MSPGFESENRRESERERKGKRKERLMDISKLHMRALSNYMFFSLVLLWARDVSAVSFIVIDSSSSQQC